MSWMQAPEGLVKLRVALPNHPHVKGETLWGKPVSGGLYEVRNVPFHAYGLNFRDLVEVSADAAVQPPTIRQVRVRSGHRTLRVCFTEEALLEERVPNLMTLRALGATFEGASQAYFAIDVEPGGAYGLICEHLEGWRDQGILTFETCEARDGGSFDMPAARELPATD
jgi:hypothetical protein